MSGFAKQPSAQRTIAVDWVDALPSGASLVSCTVTAKDKDNVDVSATLLSGTTATISGTRTIIRVKAGTSGQRYTVTFVPTFSNGDTDEEDVIVWIEEKK